MLIKALDELTYADIISLVQTRASESLYLDFKACAVGGSDRDKREFLADVSAFANTEGGDLVFGIEEENGEAVRATPFGIANPDAEKLRLLQIIQNGLEPRLTGTEIIWLDDAGDLGFLLVRVPKSWNSPHRVTFNRDLNFFVRNSSGRNPMNVDDLRRSFNLAASFQDRARAFRSERVTIIQADQGPVPLVEGAKFLLHTIPLAALSGGASLKLNDRMLGDLPPMQIAGGWNFLYSIDGFATFDGPDAQGSAAHSYSLAFTTGIIEAVGVFGFRNNEGELKFDLETLEISALASWGRHLDFFRKNAISGPLILLASIIDAAGYQPMTRSPYFRSYRGPRQATFSVADILIGEDEMETKRDVLLRPVFDRVANAFGLSGSPFYGADGRKRGIAT